MGRVNKGINCSVKGCSEQAERSMSEGKGRMATDLDLASTSKRIYLCKNHYKEWKKATKEDRETERARWK
ncbi:MAG: hypothetical protein AB7F53_00315 [Nitrososphaeraceae archaeon]|jgi:hypothetical protein